LLLVAREREGGREKNRWTDEGKEKEREGEIYN